MCTKLGKEKAVEYGVKKWVSMNLCLTFDISCKNLFCKATNRLEFGDGTNTWNN